VKEAEKEEVDASVVAHIDAFSFTPFCVVSLFGISFVSHQRNAA
jgi:hypothetical protein